MYLSSQACVFLCGDTIITLLLNRCLCLFCISEFNVQISFKPLRCANWLHRKMNQTSYISPNKQFLKLLHGCEVSVNQPSTWSSFVYILSRMLFLAQILRRIYSFPCLLIFVFVLFQSLVLATVLSFVYFNEFSYWKVKFVSIVFLCNLS